MFFVDKIALEGICFKTVFSDQFDINLPDKIITNALFSMAKHRVNLGSLPYYARDFLQFLDDRGTSICTATINDIRCFADAISSCSDGVISQHAVAVDAIYDTAIEFGIQLDSSLYAGLYQATPLRGRNKRHCTIAGRVIRKRKSTRRGKDVSCPTYEKWYTDEQIDQIVNALSLRDKCIFLIELETGYRISSVLSIMLNFDQIKRGIVAETMSKTGKIHEAKISPMLTALIVRYISAQRSKAIRKCETAPKALFLTNKGTLLSYNAYNKNLKNAAKRIVRDNPEMEHLVLHTHAGRSTFFNRLMLGNEEKKRNGERYYTDQQIMNLMDWKTMDCLTAYYNFTQNKIEPTVLWKDLQDDI